MKIRTWKRRKSASRLLEGSVADRMKSFTIYCLLTIGIWQRESTRKRIFGELEVGRVWLLWVLRKPAAVLVPWNSFFVIQFEYDGEHNVDGLWWEKWLNASLKLCFSIHTHAGSISHINSNTALTAIVAVEGEITMMSVEEIKRFVRLFLCAFGCFVLCTRERFSVIETLILFIRCFAKYFMLSISSEIIKYLVWSVRL